MLLLEVVVCNLNVDNDRQYNIFKKCMVLDCTVSKRKTEGKLVK